MKIDLNRDMAFYRTLAEGAFFLSVLVVPIVAVYTFGISLLIGRVHGIGAWVGMWRAGKLNWIYVTWMMLISIGISVWGLGFAPYIVLTIITYFLFAFHYFFDEYELQQKTHMLQNGVQSFAPFALISLYLFSQYLQFHVDPLVYILAAVALMIPEALTTEVYNWFYIQMKITTLFVIACVYLGVSASNTLNIFLLSHYMFWFIYPVYNLNKYKPEERDGFIMIMLLLIATSFYYAYIFNAAQVSKVLGAEFLARSFLCGTLIHVLSTAPFGYAFGLPKPRRHASPATAQAHIVPTP